MEGAGLGAGDAKLGETMAHLIGGAARERHGEHGIGRVGADRVPVGDAVGDRAGLPRSCAREDGEGARDLARDCPLIGVESVEQCIGLKNRHDRIIP